MKGVKIMTTKMRNYQVIFGTILIITGIVLFAILSTPLRFLGLIFILGAIILFVSGLTIRQDSTNENKKFKSKAREQLLKYKQHRHN